MKSKKIPECACGHSGSVGLHRESCPRFVALVKKWKPPGLRVESGRIVRAWS